MTSSSPPSTVFTTLISAQQLNTYGGPVVVLDCRAKLGEPDWGYRQYQQGHLPNAQYVNLDKDLAAPPSSTQGRHPLPSQDNWVSCIRRLGINNHQQVVAYDDAGGAYAARAWWMFRWVGHEEVAVLDGGLAAWQSQNLPLDTHIHSAPETSQFVANPALQQTIAADHIQTAPGQLVDARSHERWAGKVEPIDPVAGHIPGALCLPFNQNLDDNGYFKSAADLKNQFSSIPTSHAPIAYCGSGVTACHNILAMHIAGIENVLLYPDSWSGWITDPNRPITTENN